MTTPILPGFFPDPSICLWNKRYYIANSTFQYLPGIPIHSSTDLSTWTHVGNAFNRPEQLDLSRSASNAGLYAPTIRCHEGTFYLVVSDLDTVRDGHLIIKSDDPSNEWSEPVRTTGAIGIDPDLFWDHDGTCYLSWKGVSTSGLSGILSAPINPNTGELLAEVRQLWQGSGNQASPEGPHLYRRNDYYYCLLAEGGTERTHSVTIARSKSLDGPWEAHPANPILSHRGSESGVQNVGHADFVESGPDQWIAVYLGVRPRGFTPKFHVNGRETFLTEVHWTNDWPVIEDSSLGGSTETAFTDTFTEDELSLRWISHGGIHRRLASIGSTGLTLLPHPAEAPIPALAVRARDEQWSAHIRAIGGVALQVHMDTRNWAEISFEGSAEEAIAVARLSTVGIVTELGRVAVPGEISHTAELTIDAVAWPEGSHLNAGPDVLVFSIGSGAHHTEVARFDGRLLSTEVVAGFTGRTVGIRAIGGPARVTEFDYAPAHTV